MSCDSRRAIVLLLISTGLLVLVACRKPATNSNQSPPIVSQPPPTNYPMPPLKGARANLGWTIGAEQHVRLSDYRGKVVVLDFYATWCDPCRDSIPHLVDLQKRYGAQGLQVIGLNVGGAGDPEKVPAFARELHIQYQLGNPDRELANFYMGDDDGIPLTVVLDRQGRLVQRWVGYSEPMDQELEESIKTSLAAKDVSSSPR